MPLARLDAAAEGDGGDSDDDFAPASCRRTIPRPFGGTTPQSQNSRLSGGGHRSLEALGESLANLRRRARESDEAERRGAAEAAQERLACLRQAFVFRGSASDSTRRESFAAEDHRGAKRSAALAGPPPPPSARPSSTAAFTLRQAIGLPTQPPRLSDSALIVIDVQLTYIEGPLKLANVSAAVRNCASMIERARRLRIPIFHVRHHAGAGTLYDVHGRSGAFVPPAAPLKGGSLERVITKSYPNSFEGTALAADLADLEIKNLVLVGFMTHCCISSTARAAFNKGFVATVVADCTATRALPDPTLSAKKAGGGIGALVGVVQPESGQAAALAHISDLHAIVVPSGDYLFD